MTKTANTHNEVAIELPNINRHLVIETFTEMVKLKPEHERVFNAYLEHNDEASFLSLQHHLLDLYPAILNVQIRDLFTPQGKTKGRFRLRQLNEVYQTLIQLIVSIALSDLWDATIDTSRKRAFKYLVRHKDAIKEYMNGHQLRTQSKDALQLISTVCAVFSKNKTAFYMTELSAFNELLQTATPVYQAYQFFEQHLCPQLHANTISDQDVNSLCQTTEEQLTILLKATAFLANYEIIRIKDVSIQYSKRQGEPTFVHNQIHVGGREYPTTTNSPIAQKETLNNHSIYLARNVNITDESVLNLSPFVIDQNAFKGTKHYLPKVYFFGGINSEGQALYKHVDTPSLDFVLDKEYHSTDFSYLTEIQENLNSFCEDIEI